MPSHLFLPYPLTKVFSETLLITSTQVMTKKSSRSWRSRNCSCWRKNWSSVNLIYYHYTNQPPATLNWIRSILIIRNAFVYCTKHRWKKYSNKFKTSLYQIKLLLFLFKSPKFQEVNCKIYWITIISKIYSMCIQNIY